MKKIVILSDGNLPKKPAVTSRYEYGGRLETADAVQLVAAKQAGLAQTEFSVNALREMLDKPRHPRHPLVAMRALARRGAIEALPSFAPYLDSNGPDWEMSDFAQVEKARLLAENSSHGKASGKEQAAAKVARFFQELNLTPDDLNTRPMESLRGLNIKSEFFATSQPLPNTRENFALRELADIVYQGEYEDYASLPQVAQVDFSREPGSALKMRLAPLSRQQRLSTLIRELSHKTVLKDEDNFEIQLAVNEGLPASRAAAVELRKMDTHREEYNQVQYHNGFTALFQVIWGVGDAEQAPLIKHFTADKDDWVIHYANIFYRDIRNGTPRESVWVY